MLSELMITATANLNSAMHSDVIQRLINGKVMSMKAEQTLIKRQDALLHTVPGYCKGVMMTLTWESGNGMTYEVAFALF